MSEGRTEQRRPGFSVAVWDLFRSVRLTVVLLAVLALVAIAGTIIPQSGTPQTYELIYGRFGALLVRVAGLDDAYHSTWFLLLLTGLWLNLLACTWDRLPNVLRKLRAPVPGSGSPGQVQGELPHPGGAASEMVTRLQSSLPGAWKTSVIWSGDGQVGAAGVAAVRGRAAYLAFPLTHISLMLILAGGLISGIFAVEGRLRLFEGQRADRFAARLGGSAMAMRPLGFEILCEEVQAEKDPATGRPIQYFSTLSVIDGGKPVLRQKIAVNTPLHYGPWTFYQSEYDERAGPGGTLQRLTGLQVARDPGAWWVWIGCGLLMVGLTLALMVRPERLQIDVCEDCLRVHLSGKGGREALQHSLDELIRVLEQGPGKRSGEA